MSMMPFRHWTILRSRQRRLSRADRAHRGERHGSVDFSFFKQPLAFPWGLFFVCALVFSRGSRLGCRAFCVESSEAFQVFFFAGVNREKMARGARKVKQNFRALKTLEKGGLLWSLRPKRLQKKTSLFFSWGKKRVFETFFSTKERKIFYLFFK